MVAWCIEALTAAAAGCVLASLVPEIWRNVVNPRRAKGQSLERAWLYFVGQLLWTARGIMVADWTFTAVTGLGIILGWILLAQVKLARKL